MAKMYIGINHDILQDVSVPEKDEKEKLTLGFHYMEEAANSGHRDSMVFVAQAFDTGLNLDDPNRKSAKIAIDWYEKICEMDEDMADSSEYSMEDAPYVLMARQAELWLAGDKDLKRDPNRAGELYNQAAESAMACMKGKLANKYYMLAEEAYGEVEE